MPSQLYTNDKISFLACKPFTYRGKEYSIGDDFPQEEANNIESMVRSRFVIPVVDDVADKPRHWHKHIRTREQAEEYLTRSRVQLQMPYEPDSDDVVDISKLTHPQASEEELKRQAELSGYKRGERDSEDASPAEVPPEQAAEAARTGQYDPTYHTVVEVNAHLATISDTEERERILEMERQNKARKGILEA